MNQKAFCRYYRSVWRPGDHMTGLVRQCKNQPDAVERIFDDINNASYWFQNPHRYAQHDQIEACVNNFYLSIKLSPPYK